MFARLCLSAWARSSLALLRVTPPRSAWPADGAGGPSGPASDDDRAGGGASLRFEPPRDVGGWLRLEVSDASGARMVFMVELNGPAEYQRHETALRAICARRFRTERDTVIACVITAEAIATATDAVDGPHRPG